MKKIFTLFLFSLISYMAYSNATVSQKEWRWRKDDGTETSATWMSNQEQAPMLCNTTDTIRLRVGFQVDPDPNFPNDIAQYPANIQISYSISPTGPFMNIPFSSDATGSEAFVFATSLNVSNGEPTSQQLMFTGGVYAPGQIIADNGNTSVIFSTPGSTTTMTEYEWVIRPTEVAQVATYYFQIQGVTSYPYPLPELTLVSSTVGGSTVITNATCNGLSNGIINLTASGGTEPYTFDWGGGVTTEDRIGLAAGDYSVIITDVIGCADTVDATVTEPTAITATVEQDFTIGCTGVDDEAATITASGGTGELTYLWSPSNQTTETATGLSAGTHSVTVTDGNGCKVIKEIDIVENLCTSVNYEINNSISIYPNPLNDGGAVSVSVSGNLKIERVALIDAQGRKVRTAENQEKLMIGDLDPGMYMVEIVTDKGLAIKKLLVK